MVKLIVGAIIAVFLVIGGFMLIDPMLNPHSTEDITEVAQSFTYTIEGEVSKVGTYTLSDAVKMSDLINAAGGLASNADERCYFPDATIKAGETYYISSKFDATDVCGNSAISKVNINSDDTETLMSVNGITSSIATSIVSYRQEKGTFQTLEELKEVYGIGDATYRRIRGFVILHND